MNRLAWGVCSALLCVLPGGCTDEGASEAKADKRPRPVTAFRLVSWDPGESDLISGTAASWKTEEIGFEVSGRLSFVVEREVEIEGQLYDAQGAVLSAGTELARLDPTRYQIRVESAQAQVSAAIAQKAAALLEANEVIPAKSRAAEARQQQMSSEFDRINRLLEKRVTTQEQFDVARANLDSAVAEVDQLQATRRAKEAEVSALQATIEQANQALAEAQQDLSDCVLKAPFPGQIARVHAIPGANVNRGTPVVTVQMMTPMKVEFEVSREVARSLKYNERLPIRIASFGIDAKVNAQRESGLVYQTDTTADPLTRTYTVTLLVRNRRIDDDVPAQWREQPVWKTRMLWPLRQFDKLAEGNLAVDQNAVHEDEQGGAYVWKVQNRTIAPTESSSSNELRVVKLPVQLGKRTVPFLGLYTFQEIHLPEGTDFDPQTNLVLGKLIASQDGALFAGERVLLDQSRWMIQPGDLIGVQLRRRGLSPGFYVPIDAIDQREDSYFVFLITSEGLVKSVEVATHESVGTLRRVTARRADELEENDRLIASGVHFLVDREAAEVTEELKVSR